MSKREKTLRDVIEGDLRIQIDEIWRKAKEYHGSQKGENIQDISHCKTVEKNLYKLTSKNKGKRMKQIDLFLLSAAACLHDIGKVVGDATQGWVGDHEERSKQIILEKYDKLGLNRGQACAVALLVGVHDHGCLDELPDSPFPIGDEESNVIELASLFRLADMLDTNYQRAPEILSEIKFPGGDIPSKWRGRQSITGWYLDRENRIILKAIPKKGEIDAVYTLWSMMNEELSKITPFLKLYGYPFELGELDIGNIFIETELKKGASQKRPFPGMSFYTKENAAIFKGRDREIEWLLSNVSAWPITVLIGESGAGKTSLINAGLFPRLEKMSWDFVWTRPFDDPVENIKKMIWNEFFHGESGDKTLLDVMKKAAEKCKPHKLLIVMDQFEDVLSCNIQEILEDFSLVLMAVQTGKVIPNLKVLISFREDASVKLNSRLLKRVTGSAYQFPSVELERLTRGGAKAAFEAGLENGGIGLDPRREKGEIELLEIILEDIPKDGDRLYPPYVQMVAETLCRKVEERNPIITREMYSELGGANAIIGQYLMALLNEFGSQKDKAKRILIFLTSFSGKKAKKSLNELSGGTGIRIDELREIIKRMIDLRMVRIVGNNEFEMIHDHLSEIVNEELVSEEDRTIKFLEEQLDAFYQNYKMYGTPIISSPFLAKLYRYRRQIKISEEKHPLILCTAFLRDRGLGWYWLKGLNSKKLNEVIGEHVSHEMEEVRNQAKIAFLKTAQPEDKGKIVEMLRDEDERVRKVAVEALGKIAQPKDKGKIVQMLREEDDDVKESVVEAFLKVAGPEDWRRIVGMLRDENWYVQRAAEWAFLKIAQPEDKGKIVEMLRDEDERVRKVAVEALGKIAQPEDKGKIVEMLQDEDERVRKVAVEALGKIAQPEDKGKIVEMLDDRNWYVQKAAKEAFLKIAQPEDWRRIDDMLRDKDGYVWGVAVEAFGSMVESEERDIAVMMLHSRSGDAQKIAREALRKITQSSDWREIAEILSDKDEHDREVMIKTFTRVAQHKDWGKIVEMLRDEDKEVQKAAKEAFLKIAQPKDKGKIVEILQDEDERVRKVAVEAFLKIANKDELIDLLSDLAQGLSRKQVRNFQILSNLDETFYCPYFENKEETA
jgi:HEAT repeat protein